MNRKQRRATLKHGSSAAAHSSDSAGNQINQFFFEAAAHERARKFDDAARAYKRVLALNADHAEACNNLAPRSSGARQDEGCFDFLRACARAHAATPGAIRQHSAQRSFPCCRELAEALRRQAAAWPKRLTLIELLGDDLAAIAADPLLLYLLQSTPVRDVAFRAPADSDARIRS